MFDRFVYWYDDRFSRADDWLRRVRRRTVRRSVRRSVNRNVRHRPRTISRWGKWDREFGYRDTERKNTATCGRRLRRTPMRNRRFRGPLRWRSESRLRNDSWWDVVPDGWWYDDVPMMSPFRRRRLRLRHRRRPRSVAKRDRSAMLRRMRMRLSRGRRHVAPDSSSSSPDRKNARPQRVFHPQRRVSPKTAAAHRRVPSVFERASRGRVFRGRNVGAGTRPARQRSRFSRRRARGFRFSLVPRHLSGFRNPPEVHRRKQRELGRRAGVRFDRDRIKTDTGDESRNTRRIRNKVRNQWKSDWPDDRWWDFTPNNRQRVTTFF